MKLRGLVSLRPLIIETLHDLGVLHLHEDTGDVLMSDTASELKILRGKALGLLEVLGWNDWAEVSSDTLQEKRISLSSLEGTIIDGIRESLDSFSTRLTEQRSIKADLEGQLNSLRNALRTVEHFRTFIKENNSRGNEVSIWWVQNSNLADLFLKIQKKIRENDPLGFAESTAYHVSLAPGGESVAAIAVHPDHTKEAMSVMSENGCLTWLLPGNFEGMRLDEAIPQIELEMNDIPRRAEDIENSLQKTRRSWGPKIGALYILLDEKIQEILVEKESETFGEMFAIEGWIPVDQRAQLSNILQEKFDGKILLSWQEPKQNEWAKVPTALSNPSYFRPFELFLKLMPVVRYKGLDPTIVIGIFFPFFSGCMIGDIGYGTIILALALWLANIKKKPLLRDVGAILSYTAGWSIIWGFAYGEFFGDLGHRLFHLDPLWLERSEVVFPVMVFTVSLGFAHVLLGFVLGFIQGIKSGHKHLWMERLGNIMILVALLSAMIVVKGWLPKQLFSITVTFLILGLSLLLAGGGIGGLVESLGAIGNILSYVRIAAIGLSSAILAMVATSFVDSLGLSFIGIFMAITIHLLNFVLAVAGSGLHSARLQYVEFLGKFYTGGGTEYKPFSRRKPELWKKR